MNTLDGFRKLWAAGYHRLVPVVPPKAELHERSSLYARLAAGDDSRGKAPGTCGEDGKWRGVNFVRIEAQESDLDKWGRNGASVGVKTGDGLIAVDIDTTNRQAAEKLYTLAAEILGPAAVRFGRKPKCLLLYEAPKDTRYQQVVFSTETEDKARVELLAEGRQFVAHGIHPVTGGPYTWPRGIPNRDRLTPVTADQIERFFEEARAKLPNAKRSAEKAAADAPEQEDLKAPDWETLERTVENIRNTDALFPEREHYVALAYAIKGAAPEGYELAARDLFLDWCERWEDGTNDPEIALADWERAKPPFRTGFSTLQCLEAYRLLQPVDKQEIADQLSINEMFQQEKPKSFATLLKIQDIFDLPDPTFLIDRYLPDTGFGILFGDPGSGKSFMALDMALHIAFGKQDWHGDKILPRRGGRVLYIAGEGAPGYKTRIKAWMAQNLTPEEARQDPNIRFIVKPINFMQEQDIKALLDAVKREEDFGEIDLIVVDTVSRAIPGADENLQKDMTIFINACDQVRYVTGALVLGVHHTAKAGGMRGSSVFDGQGDVILQMEKKKGATVGRLLCYKMKDGPDGWSDTYRFNMIDLPNGQTSLAPERVDASENPDNETVTPALQQQILDAMDEAWSAGKPWSDKPQSKDRFAGRIVASRFGVSAVTAMQCVELWMQQGLVEMQVFDKRSGQKGLRVTGRIVRNEGQFEEESIFD
ncbi:AAA family ATPase [Nitratireductor aquimarinus]|uniref:AAA family ATPase n=1 Tax=Nitratireductor aquimarinus TaxID=889300 RepID=UPI002935BEF7|nr:AAA family ATPase [Nitratireductor aquimarinus]MDV2964549.1 AAA family ATPase [Nitratireductor aquimarinus]